MKNYLFLLLAAVGGFVFLLILSFILYCFCKKIKQSQGKYNPFPFAKEELGENVDVVSKSTYEEKEL